MDMISTGRTAVDRDMIVKLAEELQKLFSANKGKRFTLAALRTMISRESGGEISQQLNIHEIEEAVKEILESDTPCIKYVPNTQMVIVQSGQ